MKVQFTLNSMGLDCAGPMMGFFIDLCSPSHVMQLSSEQPPDSQLGHLLPPLEPQGQAYLPPKQPRAPPWGHCHSPVRQSGFHGAHGVEGGLHGEFPGGVALAALLVSQQQQAAELLAPGGQQGCKDREDDWCHLSHHRDVPAAPHSPTFV